MTHSVTHDQIVHNFNLNTDFLQKISSGPFGLVRQSFMHDLAREGDVLSAEIVFDAGHDLDTPDEIGRRPLHEAAFFGHMDMVKFLIANGAVVDSPVLPFGHTPLYLAVQQGRHDVARELIKRGASLGAADKLMGTGLLHVAAARGDTVMAGILIAAGIDVFREDRKGMTARDAAARHHHPVLERVLLKVMQHHAVFNA